MDARIKNVLEKRILAKDNKGEVYETFEEMKHRVAKHLAKDEEEYNAFFELMESNKFWPNSPCLVNAGLPDRLNQLSACFVLDIEDSIDDIYDTLKDTAFIHKSGGGTGFNFSNIRSSGSVVSTTGGVASGPVSFMHVFDASTEGIKQGGVRRGANMGVLRVDHPDIEEFITCKRDNTSFVNFNISVGVTNNFMQALIERRDYDLVDPATGKVVKNESARRIFDLIVDNSWVSGDPGILFIDRINEHNPLTGSENVIKATNPCFSYDTQVLTSTGYYAIGDLVGKKVLVWNGTRFSPVTPKITGENQEMLKVTLSNGQEIKCTKYHTFILKDGTKVEARDLDIKDKLCKTYLPVIEGHSEVTQKYAYTCGVFCGDGSIETTRDRNSIWLYGEKKNLIDHIEYDLLNVCDGDRYFVKMLPSITNKTFVPTVEWNIQARLDYLAGLIDSDGTLNDAGGSVAIWSINKDFLFEVSRMINTLGVNCSIAVGSNAGTKSMPDGKGGKAYYEVQTCYRLLLSAYNVKKLRELGLDTNRVDITANPAREASRFVYVKDVEEIPPATKVYCFTEHINHTGIFNGQLLGQCGEQPLSPNEACGLGSINLSEFVTHGVFDYDALRQVTMTSTLFLHRMIHKSQYPNAAIDKRVKESSKIGLGHMGFADALIKMKIPYTSEEAINIAANIAQTILDASVVQTHNIGQAEGTFELFGSYRMPKHIKSALKREGIPEDTFTPANSTLTTIAPTGTISMIAGCSSGVEPVFFMEQKEIRADAEIVHRHPLLEQWKENNPNGEKPNYFQDLLDIDYETHIAIQSTFQRFVCSGVSKTVNLPKEATQEDISQIIHKAYYTGCKGVTIFRDGCKGMQVISNAAGGLTEQFIHDKIKPADRPDVLEGKTHKIKTGYGEMLVTINQMHDEPFEVICQLGKSGASEMAKAEAISRLVSILLRCRVDINTIVDQLSGIVGGSPIHSPHGMVYSIPDALSKVLDNYSKNEMVMAIPSMMKCPDCDADKNYLQSEGSCIKCVKCGWRSCG